MRNVKVRFLRNNAPYRIATVRSLARLLPQLPNKVEEEEGESLFWVPFLNSSSRVVKSRGKPFVIKYKKSIAHG